MFTFLLTFVGEKNDRVLQDEERSRPDGIVLRHAVGQGRTEGHRSDRTRRTERIVPAKFFRKLVGTDLFEFHE